MKKHKDGKQFEKLTAHVFEVLTKNEAVSVEKDALLDGIDGPRQIDVLMRSRIAGIDILTIVECRDYGKRLDVTHLDALHSKMQDVKADKAVLVSRKGFSKKATKKAARIGVTLCTLDGSSKGDDSLESIGLEVPILLKELANLTFQCEGMIDTANIQGSEEAMKQPASIVGGIINDVVLTDRIHEAFLSGEVPVSDSVSEYEWIPPDMSPPYYVGSENDDPKLPLREFSVKISYTTAYYFGYASELSGSVILKNLSQNSKTLIIDLSEIRTDRDKFASYQNLNDIPCPASAIEVYGISVPKLELGHMKVIGVKRSPF